MTDIDLDQPVALTKRAALQDAQSHLSAVVVYALDTNIPPDEIDYDHIREAYRLVKLALREGAE